MVRSCFVMAALVLVSAMAATRATAAPVYFLVSEFPGQVDHGDSFVLPLEDADDIAHARDLVQHGPSIGGAIVNAEIVAGADNINRDILAPGKPAWSWHISNFGDFADMSIEILDGWPTFIEQDVQGWIDNTGGGSATVGRIAFWNYTVTAELQGPPTDLSIVPRTAVPLPAALPAGMAMLAIIGAAIRKTKQYN
ncbi:MAG: hypothetical protein QOE14_25 [Humisphaera sp.]|nr:hypothetical protein [Humisphaera sp.]